MMTYFDISVSLSPLLPFYPGDPEVELATRVVEGCWRTTRISCGTHSGTHLDAPAHIAAEGLPAWEIPLSLLIGPARVVDLSHRRGHVTAAELEKLHLRGEQRVLLRTRNSHLWEQSEYVADYDALTAEAAAWLVAAGIELVGIDYLSVEPHGSNGEVHRCLLESGVVILEGLNLAGVERGEYELLCLPLKTEAADGAPCRAVLRRSEAPAPRSEHHTRWPA